MARTFYYVVLCLTLGLLATMWLRPGIAQDLIDLAHTVVRAQSPDPQSVPQATPFGNQPYDRMAGPPTQPMPATRPVTWPGTPVDSYSATVGGGNNAGVTSSYGQNPNQPRPGITVWDPTLRSVVPAPGASGYANPNSMPSGSGPTDPQRPGAAFLPHATADGTGGIYPPNVAPPATAQLAQLPAQYGTPQGGAPFGGTNPTTISPQAQNGGQPPVAYGPGSPMTIPGSAPQMAQPNQPFNLIPEPAAGAQPPAATGGADQPNYGTSNVQVLPSEPKDFPDSQIVGKIGTETVLRSDVKAMAYAVIQQKKIDIPPDQLNGFLQMAERPLLKQLVEMKLVYNDAMHSVPAEGMKKIQANINDQFDKDQLPKLFTANGVTTRQELEVKLRERSSSIELERRLYFEKNLYMGWLSQKVKKDDDVPAADILGYYSQHATDYDFPGKVRWEELMVSFSQMPDKQAAFAAIAEMGNAVMRGQPFAEVAKSRSQGFTAADGGVYDWTTQGSLSAKQLDAAIFGLPVGSLSQIIETDRGYHIVRVIERKNAGRKSFEDTQAEIKKKLRTEIDEKQMKKYLDELRQRTPIWTIYDDQPVGISGPPKPDGNPNS